MQALHPVFPILSDYFDSFVMYESSKSKLVHLSIASTDVSLKDLIETLDLNSIPNVKDHEISTYTTPTLNVYWLTVAFDEEASKELRKYCVKVER